MNALVQLQRTGIRVLCLAILPALTAAPAAAQAGGEGDVPLADRLTAAVEALRTHQDTSGVAGLSAAIAVDGRLVWSGGFGYADLQHRVEAGPATVSRIGSISKPVAAVAAMALWDRGMLDLDTPIRTYLPDYPAANAHVTMRQLMSHTAGVRHYRGDEFMSNEAYTDVVSPMAVFWEDPLLFEPGTDYNYSTYGWTVVSAVTEAADGRRPWVDILYDEVIHPLGLLHMQPEWQDSVIPHHASFYMLDREAGVRTNAPEVDQSNKWAGGGLVATTADLVNFALGVMNGTVLSDEARAEMWRKQTPAGESSYGLGWNVGEIDGRRVVSHSGGSVGATAMLVLLPDHGIAVAVLGNTSGVSHAGIARRVTRILLD
ncbi:MAG: serine hydrolase domain-containing protein [Gemmatimonadota bacterium]